MSIKFLQTCFNFFGFELSDAIVWVSDNVADLFTILCLIGCTILSICILITVRKLARSRTRWYKILIDDGDTAMHPSICGVCILGSGRFVICECNRQELMVYSNATLEFRTNLPHEPKAMTRMSGDRIAITFPYPKVIKVYEVKTNSIEQIHNIDLNTVGKPFSIAYNKALFAVEIGEGDSGRILIINEKGDKKKIIKNANNFAYFNSNTIRLSLDAENQQIFVVSVSQQAVSCIDFNGNMVWNKYMSCPRGIVFVDNIKSERRLVVASKNLNLIFQMNSTNGESDILTLSGHIQSPRYLDYSFHDKLLCVQINRGVIFVYKYDITYSACSKNTLSILSPFK